ncbi:MAG: NADH-quinone oxidoreductase subunit H [Candidatus Omnitrophica bacterium]|nr:NADH-quinone oxidoreductase subunit H [Candidatus Omnitrophota bacterium]MBU4487503.1 NADH-quinone oxidoreductase subunit H [Candidatus Omnitrophota bacterium]MCG2704909.1 NADH-quinone oxidoreductase subunit H [Candidatus Omnitrophota bacterium]
MKIIEPLLQFVVFPGFLFTAVAGLIFSWIDRKVTARVQYRIGPPWYQPFMDILKLLGKETMIPAGASKRVFLTAPLIGLAGVTIVSTLLCLADFDPNLGFVGDLIVVFYMLTLPALAIILGGFSSANPLASLGSSREMKLVLSYELPFILALLVPIIKSGGLLTIGGILNYQIAHGAIFASASGFIAVVVAMLCIQAKLGLVPFDISEAETEIVGGSFIEYSGPPLAIFKLTKAMLLFTLPLFVVVVFMGGITLQAKEVAWGILKLIALLVVIVLIRNTNPRLRIDQALRFFWGPVTILAILGVVLALFGH